MKHPKSRTRPMNRIDCRVPPTQVSSATEKNAMDNSTNLFDVYVANSIDPDFSIIYDLLPKKPLSVFLWTFAITCLLGVLFLVAI